MKQRFSALKEYGGMKREDRIELNCLILNNSGFAFRVNSRGFYLYNKGVEAIFYPSTGRWRSGNTTYKGGADLFLTFLRERIR
jgi:hypothetical protein